MQVECYGTPDRSISEGLLANKAIFPWPWPNFTPGMFFQCQGMGALICGWYQPNQFISLVLVESRSRSTDSEMTDLQITRIFRKMKQRKRPKGILVIFSVAQYHKSLPKNHREVQESPSLEIVTNSPL